MRWFHEKPVGHLCLDQYCWAIYKKPTWLQRFLLRRCFGIVWKDAGK